MATAVYSDLLKNVQQDPRIQNYQLAVDCISKSPILGAGVGARLAMGTLSITLFWVPGWKQGCLG